jgi:hypothetical protein
VKAHRLVIALLAAFLATNLAAQSAELCGAQGVPAVTIAGTLLSLSGTSGWFREEDGTMDIVDVTALSHTAPLRLDTPYVFTGFWSGNRFIVMPKSPQSSARGTGNGAPLPGSTSSIQGTIVGMSATRLTVALNASRIVQVDDQAAIVAGFGRDLSVGRRISAYGYWCGRTFFATSLGSGAVPIP